ncbi:hypothetical protein MHYP_G00218990 [Metynnis hypsauchen]
MDKTVFLILSLWAAGLIKCDTSLNKCHESERRHHVRVVYESGGEPKKCAGTLIYKEWVITAKDCYGGLEGTLTVQLSDQKKKKPLVIKSSDILTPLNEPILLLKLPKSVTDIESAVLPTDGCMKPNEGDELQVSGYSFIKTEGAVNTNLMCLDVKVSKCADLPETDSAKNGSGETGFVACLITTLKEHHVDSNVQPPWEWCDKNRTLTAEQNHVQITFYISKIAVFSVISVILLIALIYQCFDRRCARSCGKSYGECCARSCGKSYGECCARSCCRGYVRCCSRYCGGCCCGWCEEYLASRMETLRSSRYKVYCVAKRTVEHASKYSVCDGATVYLITLKEDQIPKLQEGESYIIKNAKVKEDRPVSEMILENETEVFRTAPLQLNEKLIRKAKKSINPSSWRVALNDPELYLKKGYITLTGEVVSLSAPRPIQGDIPVRYIVIEEAGVRVTVSLQKEAATEPLMTGQEIKITHVKVGKSKLSAKKLMSSEFTDISRTERSLINIVGLATKDSNKVLLTEDQQELNVPFSVWHGDADQLLQTLPVQLNITKRGQEVMQMEKPNSEKMETLRSSVCRVRCVAKRTVQHASKYDFSRGSVRVSEREDVALCSVSDGATVYLITLKGDQISELQVGESYNIYNATVKEDHPVSEMILGNETRVLKTAPLKLNEESIHRAKTGINPSSERAALNDPGIDLKDGYITLTGKVLSLSAPRPIQGDIPVRYIVIEEAGVRVTVSLQKEAATEPLMTGQEIKITHVKVGKSKLSAKKLMSSEFTDISVQQGSTDEERRSLLKHEGFTTSDDSNFPLARRDQEQGRLELDMILTPAFVPELSFDNMPGVSRTVAGALTSTGKRSRTSPATGDTSEYMSTMINVSSQVPQGDITRSRPSTFLVSRDWR